MSGPATTAAAPSRARVAMPLIAARATPVPPGASTAAASNVTYLPGEDVLLLSVALPAMSPAQRRAAIGFAVEDNLAQPLDQVHVALGPQMASGSWLVGVVSRDVLAGIAVPQGHRLVPDTLTVPAPVAGWAVLGQEGRVLVRLPDGTGFAADHDWVAQLWQVEGMPRILSYGGPLPEGMVVAETARLPETADATLTRFDLGAGTRTAQGFHLPRGLSLALGVLAAFLLGHLLIAAADMVALTRIQADRAEQLRAVLAAAGIPPGDDLAHSLSRALAAREPPAQEGFLDLSTRIFATIADQSGQVSLRDLRYEAGQDHIAMTLEAASLEVLQQTESILLTGGLSVQTGAATTSDGAAEVQMTVGRGAP